MHDTARFELVIGPQEAVGRDEIDARMIRPARKKRTQNTRRRALADGHGAGNADDEGYASPLPAEELGRDGVELLRCGDVQIEQARKRQVDLLDLLDGKLFDEARERREIARHERHRRVGPQACPVIAAERAIGRIEDAGPRCRLFLLQDIAHGSSVPIPKFA